MNSLKSIVSLKPDANFEIRGNITPEEDLEVDYLAGVKSSNPYNWYFKGENQNFSPGAVKVGSIEDIVGEDDNWANHHNEILSRVLRIHIQLFGEKNDYFLASTFIRGPTIPNVAFLDSLSRFPHDHISALGRKIYMFASLIGTPFYKGKHPNKMIKSQGSRYYYETLPLEKTNPLDIHLACPSSIHLSPTMRTHAIRNLGFVEVEEIN